MFRKRAGTLLASLLFGATALSASPASAVTAEQVGIGVRYACHGVTYEIRGEESTNGPYRHLVGVPVGGGTYNTLVVMNRNEIANITLTDVGKAPYASIGMTVNSYTSCFTPRTVDKSKGILVTIRKNNAVWNSGPVRR